MKPPASSASPVPPIDGLGAQIVASLAGFFAAALLAVVAVGAFQGARPAHFGPDLAPGVGSLIAFALGWVVLQLARRLGWERWVPLVAGIASAGAAFAPADARRTVVLAAAPLLVGLFSGTFPRYPTAKGVAILAGAGIGALISVKIPAAERWSILLGSAGIIAFSPFLAAAPPPKPMRFDLRAALAFGVVILTGIVVAFWATTFYEYTVTPKAYGGMGLRASQGTAAWIFAPSLLNGFLGGFAERPWRLIAGLAVVVAGPLLVLIPSIPMFYLGSAAMTLGVIAALSIAVQRASRAARGWSILVLGLATMGGMNLAPALVRAFSKPLPGLITVDGAEVSRRTDWPFVLGFYLALATVVLLAHLAFAYEFGAAPLDPDDSTDPLPIKRKGLPLLRKGANP